MTGQKVLVTGSNGFIGSALVKKLIDDGNKVRCMIRKTSNLDNLEGLDVEYLTADVRKPESLDAAVKNVDYIFHLGGLTKAKTLSDFIKVNAWGTENLLKAVEKTNPKLKRFVLASSLAAGTPAKNINAPVNEKTEPAPVSNYGISKMEAEKLARNFMEKIPLTIIRPVSVYGPRETEMLQYFKMIEKFSVKALVSGGVQFTNLIHVDDLVRGMILAAESEKSAGQTYYLSGDGIFSWKDITAMIEKAAGKKALMLYIPKFAARMTGWINEIKMRASGKPEFLSSSKIEEGLQDYWICSYNKAKRDFGYKPKISAETGLAMTYQWYKDNGWL